MGICSLAMTELPYWLLHQRAKKNRATGFLGVNARTWRRKSMPCLQVGQSRQPMSSRRARFGLQCWSLAHDYAVAISQTASFAAGSMWVSSSGESQEGQPPEGEMRWPLPAVSFKARAPRSTTSARALGQHRVCPWTGRESSFVVAAGSAFSRRYACAYLLIADFLHRVGRPAL